MDQAVNDKYVTYQNMVSDVNTSLSDVRKICSELELNARVDALDGMKERLYADEFSVGIMGEFRRGKSTVINALLGKEILPSDIVPTSATPNYIKWGSNPSAVVNFKDGTSKTVPVDELKQYVTKITSEYAKTAESVSDAVVYYPCHFCQNGVQIVDTPGLNDDEAMTYISEQVLPTLDAIIMVLVPDSPFSASEADFVSNKIMACDMGRIIFVLNKADLLDEDDRQRLLQHLRDSIQSRVVERMSDLYGSDSKELKQAVNKMGGIRLYPISARNALKGKMKGDEEKLLQSGMPEFEDELSRVLTEERGMLKLMSPVNQIMAAISDASAMAVTRYEAYNAEYEEFKKTHLAQKEEWIEKRRKKKEFVDGLKGMAHGLYSELVKQVPGMYDELHETLNRFVDNYNLNPEDVKDDSAMEASAAIIGKKLQKELQSCLSHDVEKLTVAIHNQLGEDLVDVTRFGKEIGKSIDKINAKVASEYKNGISTGGIIAVDVATNILFGSFLSIGGIMEGWKANGLPGAVVGGAGGAALGIGTMFGLAMIGMPLLPLWAIGGLVTTLSGKKIVEKVFGKKQGEKNVVKLKTIIKDEISKTIRGIRTSRELETWLKKHTDDTYEEISGKVDAELEGLLSDFEQQMDSINRTLTKGDSERKQAQERMEKLNQMLKEISEKIEPVYNTLSKALNLEGSGA